MRDLLLIYRLDGEVAQRLFEANPEAAAASAIDNPSEGLGVKITANLDELRQLRQGLQATAQLVRDNSLLEFVAHRDNFITFGAELLDMLLAYRELNSYIIKDASDADE